MIGLSNIDVLEAVDGEWRTRIIRGPEPRDCEKPFPVAIEIADADGDGVQDVLVIDACGNWIARGHSDGSFEGVPWAEHLPDLATWPYVGAFSSRAHSIVLVATEFGGQHIQLPDPGPSTEIPWSGPFLSTPVTALVTRAAALESSDDEIVLLIQGGQHFDAWRFAPFEPPRSIATFKPRLTEPYLAPFVAIDQVSSLRLPGCGLQVLGVGRFGEISGVTARNLQLFTFVDGRYVSRDFDLDLHVHAFTAAVRLEEKDALVGIVGSRERSEDRVFSLWRLDSCGDMELLAEETIEFAWRTPDQRVGADLVPIASREQTNLLGAWNAESLTFSAVHFDGFDLRVITAASTVEGAWMLSSERHRIHVERTDLAFDD